MPRRIIAGGVIAGLIVGSLTFGASTYRDLQTMRDMYNDLWEEYTQGMEDLRYERAQAGMYEAQRNQANGRLGPLTKKLNDAEKERDTIKKRLRVYTEGFTSEVVR